MNPGYIVVRKCQFPIGTKFLGNPSSGLREAKLVDEDGDGKVRLLLDNDKPIVYPFAMLAPYIMEMNLHPTRG